MKTGFQILGVTLNPSVVPANTAAAYSANDAVGGKLTFSDSVRGKREDGVICDLLIASKDTLSGTHPDLRLWLFGADFTAVSDNAAFDISDADLLNCLGYIDIATADWVTLTSSAFAQKLREFRCFGLKEEGQAMYGQLQTLDAVTFSSANNYQITLNISPD